MHLITSRILCISFIIVCGNGQPVFEGPIESQRAFTATVDTSSPAAVLYVFDEIVTIASDPNMVALYNISVNFDDECTNPSINVVFEAINHFEDNEALFVYYPEFNDDSLIAACLDPLGMPNCGLFFECSDIVPPAGTYTDLLFYVATGDGIGDFCQTGDPLDRTFVGRFTVSCEVDIQSLCPSETTRPPEQTTTMMQGGGGDDDDDLEDGSSESSSSSESADDALRQLDHILEEEHDLRNDEVGYNDEEAKKEVVTLKFDDGTSDNLWMIIVISVCFHVAQCGFILCLLYDKK